LQLDQVSELLDNVGKSRDDSEDLIVQEAQSQADFGGRPEVGDILACM